MKRKMFIAIVGVMIIILISIILAIHFNNHKEIYTNDIKSFSLVYRSSNFAYDGRDDLYIIEENGTIRYLDMDNRKQKNTTLISTVLSVLSDSDFLIGNVDLIPNEIVSIIHSTNFSNMKYKIQPGAYDAPNDVYYTLIETDTSLKLVKLSDYSGDNVIAKFELRENIENYINEKIHSLKQ